MEEFIQQYKALAPQKKGVVQKKIMILNQQFIEMYCDEESKRYYVNNLYDKIINYNLYLKKFDDLFEEDLGQYDAKYLAREMFPNIMAYYAMLVMGELVYLFDTDILGTENRVFGLLRDMISILDKRFAIKYNKSFFDIIKMDAKKNLLYVGLYDIIYERERMDQIKNDIVQMYY